MPTRELAYTGRFSHSTRRRNLHYTFCRRRRSPLYLKSIHIGGFVLQLFEKRSTEDLFMNVGSGGGGAPVAVAAPAFVSGADAIVAPAPAIEEKKEEPKEESDKDMGFSLFD